MNSESTFKLFENTVCVCTDVFFMITQTHMLLKCERTSQLHAWGYSS